MINCHCTTQSKIKEQHHAPLILFTMNRSQASSSNLMIGTQNSKVLFRFVNELTNHSILLNMLPKIINIWKRISRFKLIAKFKSKIYSLQMIHQSLANAFQLLNLKTPSTITPDLIVLRLMKEHQIMMLNQGRVITRPLRKVDYPLQI